MDLREMQFSQEQNQIMKKQLTFKHHSHSSGSDWLIHTISWRQKM